jgi:cell division control protein 6
MVIKLDKIFDSFLHDTIFKNKSLLQSNYTPETIPHRDKQIQLIASILAPCLRLERPSNLFIYGQTGTGKTLSVQYVRDELLKKAKEQNIDLKIIYINCKLKKVADTEYRILAELINQLGEKVPTTGLPTDQIYQKFVDIIDKKKQLIIIILDEIDQAIKRMDDNFLYTFTRLNTSLNNAQISIVGISNDLQFSNNLDPRIKSSLSEEEIVFPAYNAPQIQDILRQRAIEAFKENIVGEGVLEKCSAYAAREHGDSRRALDLLRIAGELAERDGKKKLTIEFIDNANEKLERDRIVDIVETQPKQFQITLMAILNLNEKNPNENIFTGDIFNIYYNLCKQIQIEILTQRRISDIIGEFDMLGLINSRVISKGRGGRTRERKLSIPQSLLPKIKEILRESIGL